MENPLAPTAESVYEQHRDLISVCHQSIEGAFLSTKELIAQHEWPQDDPFLHAFHVRLYTMMNLERLGCGVSITKVANYGIRLRGDNFTIKLLKGQVAMPAGAQDGVPEAKTGAQRSYNHQRFSEPLQLSFVNRSGEISGTPTVELKLVMLWQATTTFEFKDLWLALPRGGGRYGNDCYWCARLPNPVESLVGVSPEPVDVNGLDLPMETMDDDEEEEMEENQSNDQW